MSTELPKRYDNSRAGHVKWALIAAITSTVMQGTNYFGWTAIDEVLVLFPLILIAARVYLYGLLVNTIHEGLRLADMDAAIDDAEVAIYQKTLEDSEAEAKSVEHQTLTPEAFADAVRG